MSTHDNNNKKWKNLVLAGGGYKGRIYRGVFHALQDKGVLSNVKNISGHLLVQYMLCFYALVCVYLKLKK